MILKGMRWWIVGLICLGTIVNYLSRNTLGVLAPVMMSEMHFTTAEYSYVVGAFQIAYTIMQPVCGFILDTLGVRAGFAMFAGLWSMVSWLHVVAAGWISLALFRGLLGLTEAAAIPAGVKAIAEWFPARQRSQGMGLFNIGTSVGAMLAPPMVVALQQRFGWHSAFLATGGLGFVFAGLWWTLYRSPARHPFIGEDELAMIEAGQTDQPARAQRASVPAILSTRRFWGVALPRFLAEPAWQTFTFWIPLYLTSVRGMDLKEMAMFAWLPFLAADLGSLVGGFLPPLLMRKFGMKLVNSRLTGVCIGSVLMIAPGCVGLAGNPHLAIALFCIGGFAHQIISALINTLAVDMFGRHEIGTASGLAGMAAWSGGLGFSLLVGALADSIGYNPLFACLSVFDLIGAGIAVLLLSRSSK